MDPTVKNLEEKLEKLTNYLDELQKDRDDLKEQELMSFEIFTMTRDKVLDYARTWSAVLLGAFTILGIVLSLFGIKEVSDIRKLVSDAEAEVQTSVESATSDLNKRIDTVVKDIEKTANETLENKSQEIVKDQIESSSTIDLLRRDFSKNTKDLFTAYDNSFIIQRRDISENKEALEALNESLEKVEVLEAQIQALETEIQQLKSTQN